MVGISTLNKKLICAIATKLINLGIDFEYQVKDNCILINGVTKRSVLDQQISEQKKRNELEQLKTEQALITSRGLTKEILYKQFIDKWDGKNSPLWSYSRILENNKLKMRRTPLLAIWAISFALTILLANEMNIVFWLSFTVFALCSIYMEKHSKRLKREK